jgi:hypothetical protein
MPKNQQQQQQQQMTGGEGAADWGKTVFGDANQQQPVSSTNNAIAVHPPSSCGVSNAAIMNGGGTPKKQLQQLLNQKMQEMQQQQQQQQQQGGSNFMMQQLQNLAGMLSKSKLSNKDLNEAVAMTGGSGVLENIAVPAILLYLNQRIAKKSAAAPSAKNHKSMKLRKSSRMSRRYRK